MADFGRVTTGKVLISKGGVVSTSEGFMVVIPAGSLTGSGDATVTIYGPSTVQLPSRSVMSDAWVVSCSATLDTNKLFQLFIPYNPAVFADGGKRIYRSTVLFGTYAVMGGSGEYDVNGPNDGYYMIGASLQFGSFVVAS